MNKNQKFDKAIRKAEETQLVEDDYNETPPNDIVAFNELRSCADLFRMYKLKQLDIEPDFQRDIIWLIAAQTRFIDSLVKQLPIPSMCIALDYNTGKRLMIDGLQRIYSVISFLDEEEFVLSKLEDIDPRISGKSNNHIKIHLNDIYSRVENMTIPITVLRCDFKKRSHMEYLFTIFHRLNTGGNKLSNQEIRNCIYQGKFNDTLKTIVNSDLFRKTFDLKKEETYRYQYEEFVLRVFAMESNLKKYNGKLSKFLNDYMCENKNMEDTEANNLIEKFRRVNDLIYNKIFSGESYAKLSRTVIEALFVATMCNINSLENKKAAELKKMFNDLKNHKDFSYENLKEGLAQTNKVKSRLTSAIEICSKV